MKWFGSISPERLSQIDARHICVIKPSAFGDIVQSLPVLSTLRARFPHARLAWVVKRQWAELLEGHPDLDELIAFDTQSGFAAWRSFLRDLRLRRFDLVLDLQGLFRTGLMTWATRAPVRVGLETAREGANLACNCVLPGTSKRVPAHARYRRVAEAIDPGLSVFEPRLPLRDEHVEWARSLLRPLASPRVALHIGAAWPTKRWPVRKFAAIAMLAVQHFNASLVLVGGPGDSLGGRTLEGLLDETSRSRAVNLIGQSNLAQLMAVLADVDLMISNDSGPMHLAAALNTPTVGIFTCTDPDRSGPGGEGHEMVSTRVSCRASYRKKCPHRGSQYMACLEELDVERVWQACRSLLERTRRG